MRETHNPYGRRAVVNVAFLPDLGEDMWGFTGPDALAEHVASNWMAGILAWGPSGFEAALEAAIDTANAQIGKRLIRV